MKFTFTKSLLVASVLAVTTSYSFEQHDVLVENSVINNSATLSKIGQFVLNTEDIENNQALCNELAKYINNNELLSSDCQLSDIKKFLNQISGKDTNYNNISLVFSKIAQKNAKDDGNSNKLVQDNKFSILSKLFAAFNNNFNPLSNDDIFTYQFEEIFSAVIYYLLNDNNSTNENNQSTTDTKALNSKLDIIKNLKTVENKKQLNEALDSIQYSNYYNNVYIKQVEASDLSKKGKDSVADFYKKEHIEIESWNLFIEVIQDIKLLETFNQFVHFINMLKMS